MLDHEKKSPEARPPRPKSLEQKQGPEAVPGVHESVRGKPTGARMLSNTPPSFAGGEKIDGQRGKVPEKKRNS